MSEKNPFYGSTFAERKAAREAVETPDVKAEQGDNAENKAVARKSTRTKKA